MTAALASVLLSVALCVAGVPVTPDVELGGRLPAARAPSHGPERGYSVSVSPDVRSSFIGPPPRSLVEIAGGAFVGTSFSDPIPRKYPVEQSLGSSNPGDGAYGVASIHDRPANGRYSLTYGKGLYRIRRQAERARPRIGVSYKKPEGEYGVGSVFARPTGGRFPVTYGSSGPFRVRRQVEAVRPRFGVSYKKPEGEYGVGSVFVRPPKEGFPVSYGSSGPFRVRRQIEAVRPRFGVSYKKPEGEYGVASVHRRPFSEAFPVTDGSRLYRTRREAAEPSNTTGGAKIAISFKKPEGMYHVGSIYERAPPVNYPTVDSDIYDIKHFKKDSEVNVLERPSNGREEPYDGRTHLLTVPVDNREEAYGVGTAFLSSMSDLRPLEVHSEVSMDLEEALRISSSDETPVVIAHDEQSPAGHRRRPFAVVKAPGASGRRGPVVRKVVFKRVVNENPAEGASFRPVLRIPDSVVLPGDRPHHHQDPQHLQQAPPLVRIGAVSTAPIEYAPAFPFGTSDIQQGEAPQPPQGVVHNPNGHHHDIGHHSLLGDKKHLNKHATPTRPPTTELVPVPTSKFVFNRNLASKISAGRFKTPSGARSPYAAGADQASAVQVPVQAAAQAPAVPLQQVKPAASPSLPPAVPTSVLSPVQPTYATYQQSPVSYTPYAPVQQPSYPIVGQPQHPAYSTVGYSAPYPEFLVHPYGQDNVTPYVAAPQTAFLEDIYGIDTGTPTGFKS